MSYIKISNLSKAFPDNNLKVLDNLSFSIKKGEFVSFVGPSGCGKTTLFDILSGVIEKEKGSISINGKMMSNPRGLFGYMTQDPSLLPWRTALGNIALGGDISGKDKIKTRKKASKLLDEFGLMEFSGYYPSALSGGIKQRIALLRTVLFNDKVLLLDEPFGALDALTRLSGQQFLMDLKKKLKPTILMVTHDVREALYLSDTVYVLSKRPARIIAVFDVKIRKTKEQNQTKTAGGIEKKILDLLLEKSFSNEAI